jgi:hypothetical protein
VVVNLAVLGTLVFVLSVLSYRFVEYPALIRKEKPKAESAQASTAAPTPDGEAGAVPPAALTG